MVVQPESWRNTTYIPLFSKVWIVCPTTVPSPWSAIDSSNEAINLFGGNHGIYTNIATPAKYVKPGINVLFINNTAVNNHTRISCFQANGSTLRTTLFVFGMLISYIT